MLWSLAEFGNNEYLQGYLGGYTRGFTIIFSVSVGVTLLTIYSVGDIRRTVKLPTTGSPLDTRFSGVDHTTPASEEAPIPPRPQILPEAGDHTITIPKESPLAKWVTNQQGQYRNVEVDYPPSTLSELRRRVGRKRTDTDNGGA
jgi:hypothetical protein